MYHENPIIKILMRNIMGTKEKRIVRSIKGKSTLELTLRIPFLEI